MKNDRIKFQKMTARWTFCMMALLVYMLLNVQITQAKPKIKIQPQTQLTRLGGNVEFELKASGKKLTYQWYVKKPGKKWKKIQGATRRTYIRKSNIRQIGWKYRCMVKDRTGNRTSKTVMIKITDIGCNQTLPWASTRALFMPKSPDGLCFIGSYKSIHKAQIKKAIDFINKKIGRTFVYTPDPSVADIMVSDYSNGKAIQNRYVSQETADNLNANKSWVAVSYSTDDTAEHFLVMLNNSYLRLYSQKMINMVIVHELGHCIGVTHSPYQEDIMYGTITASSMSANDIQRFKQQRLIMQGWKQQK